MKKSKIGLFAILLALNLGVTHFCKLEIAFEQIILLHIFLFLLMFATTLIQNRLLKDKTMRPAFFLSINFLRMIACVVFLLPIILRQEEFHKAYIYNFFICYFFYIFCTFNTSKNNNKNNRVIF